MGDEAAEPPPPNDERPAPPQDRPSDRVTDTPQSTAADAMPYPPSRQVSWWSVHELVDAVLKQVNGWPTLGTPAWCSLANDDPAKWAALFDGAQHWALQLEMNQEVIAEASHDVSGAADWSAIATSRQSRAAFYEKRPYLKRSVS